MNRSLLSCLITFLLALTSVVSCSASQPQYHPGGPYYYKSWAHYVLPYRPAEEISKTEVEELERQGYAYYIAYFNEQGLIRSYEKRYQGKVEFKVTYFYENGVLRKEESLDSSGKVKVTSYDKKGERVKP